MPSPSELARGNIVGNWVLAVMLSPASVAANTTAEQTFAVTGLAMGDFCEIIKPTTQGGLGIVNSRVSAAGVLAIAFANVTGTAITPTASEVYSLLVSRPVNVASNVATLTSIN